jgi:hypothetical protein
MAKVTTSVSERQAAWISAQPMFFVATAPDEAEGHVNVSPKGLAGTFTLLDPTHFAYLDLNGSGAETIAHIRQNGRLTVMFCALAGPPQVLRLYGRGHYHALESESFEPLFAHCGFSRSYRGMRALIELEVTRVSVSCGFGVPEITGVQERPHLLKWASTRTLEQINENRLKQNRFSIDGLPAVEADAPK